MSEPELREERPKNFIEKIIEDDLGSGRVHPPIITRFPPEPNGYLHIGHAKSICLNFGLAKKYGGRCHLRFDDTNPAKEEVEYIESIREDIAWLGFDWGEHEYFASDYFSTIYDIAIRLIEEGKAYVDSLTPDQVKAYRGTLTEPGMNSPDRERSVEENMRLFLEMKNGIHPEGSYVLRAKIDMASPNLNMRDPALFRIKHTTHHRTGDTWAIYPMYDFTHPISDALENITHSICTLEFEDHRPLYDWTIQEAHLAGEPHQYEFARLNLTYTVMSKRFLLRLVKEGFVQGWDDPRMPTIAGIRRRGFPPEALHKFADVIGVAKNNSVVDIALLEHCVREHLNAHAKRLMVVLDPIRLIIDNYPEGTTEWFEAENNPEDSSAGTRMVPFTRELFIERSDFMEQPPKKYFRLYPGNEVRLKHAYLITCTHVVKDSEGVITEIHCSYDPLSRGGSSPDGRKVRGTSHWVSAEHGIPCEVRLYDRLFTAETPGERTGDMLDDLNPQSLTVLHDAIAEPALKESSSGDYLQFLRNGYFCIDARDSSPDHLVCNRTLQLKDSWEKEQRKN